MAKSAKQMGVVLTSFGTMAPEGVRSGYSTEQNSIENSPTALDRSPGALERERAANEQRLTQECTTWRQ